ncbi:MAG TPA: translation initiation factor IF-2 [Anaerolineae bacterium]|nr:translation initiation factor IF-2 [Anaerolineae bacterium]
MADENKEQVPAKPEVKAEAPKKKTTDAPARSKPTGSATSSKPVAPTSSNTSRTSSTRPNSSVKPTPARPVNTSQNTARPASTNPNATRPVTSRPTSPSSSKPVAPRPNGTRPASNAPSGARPPQRPANGQRPANVAGKPQSQNARPMTGARPTPGMRPTPSTTPGARPAAPKPAAPIVPPKPAPPPVVTLPSTLTVRDLATMLKLTPIDIIKKLMANGVMANITQSIDFDTAALIAGELGFEVKEEKPEVVEETVSTLSSIPKKLEYTEEELKKLKPRPPVVTVMGHVDHGKTSLLDAIRNTNVVAGEFGGITQHIGAYQVVHNGKKITFLDTPGHEAFTAMRARGAKATDIAIIVVAADDGVMPTTREAIEHARAAQVPIIVAMNKIDRPTANPERVKQQLSDIGLEVYGGKDEVTVVPVSAKQHIGIDELLENIQLVAELADLKADPNKLSSGVVIESRLDKQQGPTATLLVQEGELNVGDFVLVGETSGKIRAMFNERGETVEAAGPATPVVVTGLSDVPPAGEPFEEVATEQEARNRAYQRIQARRAKETKTTAVSLNDLYTKFKEGSVKELNLLVKADVAGSLEPIVSSLEKLGNENLHVKILRQGIGTVTQADVMLAAASQGIIIAFNVGVEPAAETLAEQEKVDIRTYNIIYKLIEDIDKALKGMLEPEYKDVLTGRAQVLKIFNVKKNVIAGCRVIKGTVARGSTAKVLRGGNEIHTGPISSLKRFTEDVKEVAEGYECGIGLEGFNNLQEGDLIEFYKKERVS